MEYWIEWIHQQWRIERKLKPEMKSTVGLYLEVGIGEDLGSPNPQN